MDTSRYASNIFLIDGLVGGANKTFEEYVSFIDKCVNRNEIFLYGVAEGYVFWRYSSSETSSIIIEKIVNRFGNYAPMIDEFRQSFPNKTKAFCKIANGMEDCLLW